MFLCYTVITTRSDICGINNLTIIYSLDSHSTSISYCLSFLYFTIIIIKPFYYREYPIRTDVIFQPNKFQAYHFRPLSQFSFFSSLYKTRYIHKRFYNGTQFRYISFIDIYSGKNKIIITYSTMYVIFILNNIKNMIN